MKKITGLLACLLCCAHLLAQHPDKAVARAKRSKVTAVVSKEICVDIPSYSYGFTDYKHYMLLTGSISQKKYIYWKKERKLTAVVPDTNLIRSYYLDFLKDTDRYRNCLAASHEFKPRVDWLTPYNDSTIMGSLTTYRSDTVVRGADTTIEFSQVLTHFKVSANKPLQLIYLTNILPIENYFITREFFTYKKDLYFDLSAPEDELLQRKEPIWLLARFREKKGIYSFDRFQPEQMHDYLIKNEVFHNYNLYYEDNGYMLMSLSNYIVNLETGEKIMLPLADSIFRKLRINKDYSIDFYIEDFKFNPATHKFYIIYYLNKDTYIASFNPHADSFEKNELLYIGGSAFEKQSKDVCLSWDGTQLMYGMKGDPCIRYISVADLQQLAKDYKSKPE